jgi:hypothetical protein
MMFRYPVLLLALVLSLPALWSSVVDGSMSIDVALLRFLIAMPVAAAMLAVLGRMSAGYRHSRRPARARTPDAHAEPAQPEF